MLCKCNPKPIATPEPTVPELQPPLDVPEPPTVVSTHGHNHSQEKPVDDRTIIPTVMSYDNRSTIISVVAAVIILLVVLGVFYSYCKNKKNSQSYDIVPNDPKKP